MNNKKYYVYRHYIGDNTFYVGKGSLGSRNRAYETGDRRNDKWLEFVGDKKFEVEIIKYFNSNIEAVKYEAELTKHYKKMGQCFANTAIGASLYGENNPMFNKKHSNETKEKIRKAVSGENNGFYGRKHLESTKKKIAKSNSGENHPMFGVRGSDSPHAKQVEISINGVIHISGCKKEMHNILLEKYGISSRNLLNGNVAKKYKDMVEYIKINNVIIYKK